MTDLGSASAQTGPTPSVETPALSAVVTVYWEEDPGRQRDVVGFCRVCYRNEAYDWSIDFVGVVSPNGISHLTEDDRTYCGKDAAGPDWWWRS